LGERVRSEEERDALKQTLIDVLKVKDFSVLSETKMYVAADGDALKLRLHDAAAGANASANDAEVNATSPLAKAEASQARRDAEDAAALSDAMAWTPAAKRLFSLVVRICISPKSLIPRKTVFPYKTDTFLFFFNQGNLLGAQGARASCGRNRVRENIHRAVAQPASRPEATDSKLPPAHGNRGLPGRVPPDAEKRG
jgi:hypothetical protein|tara:strand:+ start:1949 stop:2539 length:591 start_codon:yes stop_codon:yes gene_type:complete